jgi:hypothetical protein
VQIDGGHLHISGEGLLLGEGAGFVVCAARIQQWTVSARVSTEGGTVHCWITIYGWGASG